MSTWQVEINLKIYGMVWVNDCQQGLCDSKLVGSNMQKEQCVSPPQPIGITTGNTDNMEEERLTMGSHVVSQQSFCCKTFGAVRTLEPLTYSTQRHPKRELQDDKI